MDAETPVSPSPAPVARGVIIRNLLTVFFLISLPIIGLAAVWTIAPWRRRARIIVSAVVGPYAVYYFALVMYALIRAAFA